jgi:hypothetical protein
MAFHGSKDVAAAGTSEPLVASTVTTPTLRFCSRLTVQYKSANAGKIYGGFATAESGLSSSTFGWYLDAGIPSITLESVDGKNSLDLATVWIDAATTGEGVTFTAEQV